MATIGLDKLYYAKITEAEDGEETYGTPEILAKAISAELSVELAEATLYADDGASEVVKDFKSGKLTLGVDDIGITAAQDLTGAAADDNGVLISAGENIAPPVAIGFRALRANGKYRYFWLYRVIFGIPSANLQTKGDSITFPRRASRARSCAATSRTPRERIRGRRRFPRAPRALRPKPSLAGSGRCTSRPTPKRRPANKEG